MLLKSRRKTKTTKPTELRSRIMRAIKSSNTGPEKIVAEWLNSARFIPVTQASDLPGKPDFSLPNRKIAVFVHGCFWHGHTCRRGSRKPKTNSSYWQRKLAMNKKRDARNAAALRRMGWHVITLWECSIRQESAHGRLLKFLTK